jgi:hypothetical protein
MLETRMELCNSTLILEFLYSFTASESQPVLQKDVGFQCSRFISTVLRLFLSYGAACYYSQVIVKEDTCFQHALKVALLIFYLKLVQLATCVPHTRDHLLSGHYLICYWLLQAPLFLLRRI